MSTPVNVNRSLQQLVASAIKHSATEVSFQIANSEKTTLRFKLADNRSSELELPISSTELASLVLERARLFLPLSATKVRTGLLRTEFSSMVSDCEVMFASHGPNDSLSRVVLSNFHVDAPDRAGFWLGFEDSVSEKLRLLASSNRGLLILWDELLAGRTEALSAMRAAYPQAELIPTVDLLTDDLAFVERAKEKLVIVGMGGRDPFSILRSLLMFRPDRREHVLGMILQAELPRSCISCREKGAGLKDLKLAAQFGALQTYKNKGCNLCAEKGTIGQFSLASLIPMTGAVKKLYLEDSPWLDLLEQLRLEGFYHPFEYGLRAISVGETCEESLINFVSRPEEPYKLRHPKVEVQTEIESSVSETGRFVISSGFFTADAPMEAPMRGAEIFIAKAEAKAESKFVEQPPASRSKRVLVIDDDPDQRAILGKVFQLAGYTVTSAADGIDGVISASNDLPEVIIVDLMMPNMDGRETIKRLKENAKTKEVPIVALTAYPDPDVEYDLLDAGADDFCPKSVSKKILLKRVERLVS